MTITRNIHFEFDQDVVQTPLLYQMNREFDVMINIRGASVSEQGGFIALELKGASEEIDRVVEYLAKQGIEVAEGLGGGA